jgi:U4/U6.U5 tri-snRNP-associated protein 1
MSAREKEDYARSQNTFRDQVESRQLAEHFNKEYKPNVELKYIDDFGRSMNQKEAFKHLSHQFHGKGSGKQKTEKMLKKIEDEKRKEAQSSLDGSQIGGMSNATAQQRKKQRQAGVRLA